MYEFILKVVRCICQAQASSGFTASMMTSESEFRFIQMLMGDQTRILKLTVCPVLQPFNDNSVNRQILVRDIIYPRFKTCLLVFSFNVSLFY